MNGIDAMIYSKAISAHNVPASVSLGRVITISEGILCITSAPSKKEYTVKGRTWIHNWPWNLPNHLTAGSNKNLTELSEGACNYAGFSRFLETYKKWSKWRAHDRQAQGIICEAKKVHFFFILRVSVLVFHDNFPNSFWLLELIRLCLLEKHWYSF